MDLFRLPRRIRPMHPAEYQIVSRVFGNTLPYRIRILVTDGAGLDGRPFTIPTSLVSTLTGWEATIFAVGLGPYAHFLNLAYLINVGDEFVTLGTSSKDVLVHETAHVWQGNNSVLPSAYVFSSIINQCFRANAYAYEPGKRWSSYNVEQQASIVEDWFMSGESTSSVLYPYIVNHVRKGDA
jgi:hypothetical protein